MDGAASDPASAIPRATAARPPWTMLRTSALRRMGRLLCWPADVHRARQILHRLSGLTDRELRDIGLTRRDLDAVRALPLDADPSAALARLVEERRCRPRAGPGGGEPRRGPP